MIRLTFFSSFIHGLLGIFFHQFMFSVSKFTLFTIITPSKFFIIFAHFCFKFGFISGFFLLGRLLAAAYRGPTSRFFYSSLVLWGLVILFLIWFKFLICFYDVIISGFWKCAIRNLLVIYIKLELLSAHLRKIILILVLWIVTSLLISILLLLLLVVVLFLFDKLLLWYIIRITIIVWLYFSGFRKLTGLYRKLLAIYGLGFYLLSTSRMNWKAVFRLELGIAIVCIGIIGLYFFRFFIGKFFEFALAEMFLWFRMLNLVIELLIGRLVI